MGSQGQGHNQAASKHLHQQEFTPGSLEHKSPLQESLQKDPGLPSESIPVFVLPLGPRTGSLHGLGLQRQQGVWSKLGLPSPWDSTFPSSPASTDVLSTPSPGAGSWSSKARQR